MVKGEIKLLAFIFLAIILFQNISAIDTEIKIKTVPFGNVNLNILDPNSDSFSVIERMNKDATNYGDVVFVYSSDLSKFDISIFVKRNEERIFYEKYLNLVAGEPLSIVAVKEGTQLFYAPNQTSTNTTTNTSTSSTNITANNTNTSQGLVENTTPQSQDNTQQTPGITGMSTSEDSGKGGIFSNSLIYFIVGILVLGAIVFTGALRLRSISRRDYSDEDRPQKGIKVKKLSERLLEMKEERKTNPADYQKAIEEAEMKIKEAQKEITKIKNSEKISEIKKRMESDKKELEKLQDE